MDKLMALITFLILSWAILWVLCSDIDKHQCHRYGLTYYETTILLDGYCQRSDGLIVPAWKAGE